MADWYVVGSLTSVSPVAWPEVTSQRWTCRFPLVFRRSGDFIMIAISVLEAYNIWYWCWESEGPTCPSSRYVKALESGLRRCGATYSSVQYTITFDVSWMSRCPEAHYKASLNVRLIWRNLLFSQHSDYSQARSNVRVICATAIWSQCCLLWKLVHSTVSVNSRWYLTDKKSLISAPTSLCGVTILQTFWYYKNYPHDPRRIKILVRLKCTCRSLPSHDWAPIYLLI